MLQVTWQPGNDYVIVGREDVLSAPFGQIEGRTLSPDPRKPGDGK